jgi:hypothetical protein
VQARYWQTEGRVSIEVAIAKSGHLFAKGTPDFDCAVRLAVGYLSRNIGAHFQHDFWCDGVGVAISEQRLEVFPGAWPIVPTVLFGL